MNPRYVLKASYGNDSIALIQRAYEQGLDDGTGGGGCYSGQRGL